MEKTQFGPFPFTALPKRPHLQWPAGAQLALWVIPNIEVFMLDYPMPGENNERPDPSKFANPHVRRWSQREYGNRAGVWRLMELLKKHDIRGTVALNSLVCDHRPEIVHAAMELGWEFMGHNQTNSRRSTELPDERDEIRRTLDRIERFTGKRPRGWLGAGLDESWETLDILIAEGVDYVADWVCDDLPFKMNLGGKQIVSIPYTFECNDVPHYMYKNYTPAEYDRIIRAQFDALYREGATSGRAMSIAIHPWQSGLPHKVQPLDSALEYIGSHPGVWKATGSEIVDYYLASDAAI